VRRFTPQATKIIKLIPGDAGRPITDLVSDLQYPELADDARVVLQKLAAVEKTISARDGRWFTVRIMPYRTMDDRINGVVITFANITVAKNLEGKLRGKHTALEKRVAEDSAERAASEAGGGKPTKAAGKIAAHAQIVKRPHHGRETAIISRGRPTAQSGRGPFAGAEEIECGGGEDRSGFPEAASRIAGPSD